MTDTGKVVRLTRMEYAKLLALVSAGGRPPWTGTREVYAESAL